jgi:5-methylthioadenosine/S-adenosylhomocysteine deaminase
MNADKKINDHAIGRKAFIGKLGLFGAAAMGLPAIASSAGVLSDENNSVIQNEKQLLIRGGYILSMDEETGDIEKGDIHISEGSIINIGKGLIAKDAKVIDATGMIVMPGMIETHWHVWTSVLRAFAGSKPGLKYFDITAAFGKHFTPDDMFISTELAATEAIYSGITFIHDWCHNVRSIEHAKSSIRALKKHGIRGRFSVGLPAGADQHEAIDLDIVGELLRHQKPGSSDMISIGLACPEAGSNMEIRKKEIAAAHTWGIPVTMHAGRKEDGSDSIGKIKDLLGKDMQIVHGVSATEEELKWIADAGASLSLSPFSELRIGYGFPPVPQMLASGIDIGLSVDTFPLSGNADMFAVMKVCMNLANALSKNELIVPARRILELATIEGARSMGVDRHIGSLRKGKRADIILINTRTPNMMPVADPVTSVVMAAQPANVDTVIIEGKIRKSGGRLLNNEQAALYERNEKLLTRLKKQAGL